MGRVRDARRRVSGPLDRSAFRPRRLSPPPTARSSELTRLSLYRLGLAGTYAKYRFVPRSAIVGYQELSEAVKARGGTGELHGFIAELWQRHGAPSPAVVDAFLSAARELDRREAPGTPGDLDGILAEPRALARAPRVGARDLDHARGLLLEAWLQACAPRSRPGQIYDQVELAVCFVLRRVRQYAYAAAASVRGRRRRVDQTR